MQTDCTELSFASGLKRLLYKHQNTYINLEKLRLTHLKLAGFKSFVDPTTLHIHGQRVGVVGPNGCGKSNVMESVRWVLGESSAKEMRGDSMQDVIFNGSANRKPISRASVELVFDNSLGGATGEWSQYAEISVKRVIERDKGSSYYINNTAVRRRDVADLFLGTGLGGRAYAIIGQNTISRIVEAKPEELRIFLEEAAGISKYKERRRETELRLRDTRENLTRVEDIRQEMEKQINRLESQALVTEQYHKLQEALKLAQGQLWLVKKREASLSWEKSQRQVEKLVNELEAQMANLRKAESLLETMRQEHYKAGELVQAAQTRYYEANAEVSSLESQVKHTQEARERLLSQLQQITTQSQKVETQLVELANSLKSLQEQQHQAEQEETSSQQTLQQARAELPDAEKNSIKAQQEHAQAQRKLSEAEQNIRIESNNLDFIQRNINEISQRLQRMVNEQAALQIPSDEGLHQKQLAFDAGKQELEELDKRIVALRQAEQLQLAEIAKLRETLLSDERQLAQLNAQIHSLSKLQAAIGQESKLDSWLSNHGLSGNQRIWQQLGIAAGWETSLEAVLGARLNAIVQMSGSLTPASRPPVPTVIAEVAEAAQNPTQHPDYRSLLGIIEIKNREISGLLDDWLSQVYLLEEGVDAEQARLQLQAGQCLVNRQGDIYTRHSVYLHAAQSAMHGVLERQRELEELQTRLPKLNTLLINHQQELSKAESSIKSSQQESQELQQALRVKTQSQHGLSMEIQRLQQQRQHALDRQKSLQSEQDSLRQRLDTLQIDYKRKQEMIDAQKDLLDEMQNQRSQTFSLKQSTESALNLIREKLQKAEKLAQEKTFNKKLLINNINELNNRVNLLNEEKNSLINRQKEAETLLEAAKMENLKANLEAALLTKQEREKALAESRNLLATVELDLQNHERARMQTEQLLHPLRDKLEQGRLQEQQARLNFEQCQAGLIATGLDETALVEALPDNVRQTGLDNVINSLNAQIEELGPVNLAAIHELNSERERKTYLDSQSQDLLEAVNTLEDAIRRIDKETRSRLQATFDEANRNFGELFTTLFGGGQAKLEMLGEEILDTGMLVFAQPPGKKNSTIHLLSGGEKAMTAIALVFALFRLNPAPFCLMDEVDAPLDDSNTERFCNMVKKMSERTQFLFVSHNKITMEMAQQLIGVTMQESGVSRIVEVDIEAAMQLHEATV